MHPLLLDTAGSAVVSFVVELVRAVCVIRHARVQSGIPAAADPVDTPCALDAAEQAARLAGVDGDVVMVCAEPMQEGHVRMYAVLQLVAQSA